LDSLTAMIEMNKAASQRSSTEVIKTTSADKVSSDLIQFHDSNMTQQPKTVASLASTSEKNLEETGKK